MLPVFMPELFPANSFNGESTGELWQQFGRLGGAYAAGFLGFRPQIPFRSARAGLAQQVKSLHASARDSVQSLNNRPSGLAAVQRLARAQA